MTKRSAIVIIAIVLCLVIAQSAFAEEKKVYPNEYRMFTSEDANDIFPLSEIYWFNPTIYSVEVLEFLQAYLLPEDPVTFFLDAAEMSNEDIDQYLVIFQSFVEPDYIGIPFGYRSDIEAFEESLGITLNDPERSYMYSYYFEKPAMFATLFPRGIGRANGYDTFRRCALSLAIYASKNGSTPCFADWSAYIQEVIAYYEEQYNAAMEAEAQAESAGVAVQDGPTTEGNN